MEKYEDFHTINCYSWDLNDPFGVFLTLFVPIKVQTTANQALYKQATLHEIS